MKLKELRKKRGATQQELAQYLNITYQSYSCYENGNTQPSIENLIKLADFFNTTIDELVERKTDIINLNFLEDTRKNLIKDILKAENRSIELLNAYWQGVKLAEQERKAITENFKKRGN